MPNIKILLVDDHPLMRAGVKELLNGEQDLQVVAEATDGVTAVEIASRLAIDVVVLDISLPELSGVEAAKQMLANKPGLRILALSAHLESAYAKLMLEVGAAGYAVKRSAGHELVRAVRVVAAGGQYLDPTLERAATGGRRHSPGNPPSVGLSEREVEVVRLNAQGFTSKEMSEKLGISPRTLETYKARAMAKLSLSSRADLIRYALRAGWLKEA